MSTRYNIGPYQVIPNANSKTPSVPSTGSGNMAGNITSSPTLVPTVSQIAYQFSWSGTSPVGAISLQGSNDYKLDATGAVANAGTWTTLTFNDAGTPVQSIAVTGNTGNGVIDIASTGLYALRVVYTFTSGTGTLTATINAKDS